MARRVAGKHYLDATGNKFIILGGTAGNFSGVTTAVPEPGTLAGTAAGLAVLGLRRRRR